MIVEINSQGCYFSKKSSDQHQLSNEAVEMNYDYNTIINFEILKFFFDLVVCQESCEELQLTNKLGKE